MNENGILDTRPSAENLIGCQGVGELAGLHGDHSGDLRGLDDPGRVPGPGCTHNTQLHCAGKFEHKPLLCCIVIHSLVHH